MADGNPPMDEGRIRWRRAGAMLAAAAAAGAVLVVLTAQGILAAQFAISGVPFTVTSTRLDGTGFEQFGFFDSMTPNSPNASNCLGAATANQGNCGGTVLVAVSAIKSATLSDLCQSVNLGGTNLKITAGGGGRPVQATTLVVDSDLLTGDATFNNIAIGQDASTFTEVPGVTGPPGDFGQQADSVTITNLRQDNFATTAAAFSLPGLTLTFSDTGC
ncbi:MAG: cholesterol esterase [Chloroflexi bacterium]|nr:MAG: cholesterol esterase [Chloroflexota bacterium]